MDTWIEEQMRLLARCRDVPFDPGENGKSTTTTTARLFESITAYVRHIVSEPYGDRILAGLLEYPAHAGASGEVTSLNDELTTALRQIAVAVTDSPA
ncbi:MAG: hypothetical protein JWO59_1475 [Chloroflexi bacterium]|nr:hypothetical protein [Chloroflexota bacterium]